MNNFPLLTTNSIASFPIYNDIMSTPTDLSTKSMESPKIEVKNEESVTNDSTNIHRNESPILNVQNGLNIPLTNNLANSPRLNKSHIKSAGNKKSFVWKYFNHPKNSDGIEDRTRTECKECKSQLAFNASGTTTTMLNHLKSRHTKIAEKEEWRKVKVVNNSPKSNNNNIKSESNETNTNGNDSPSDSFMSIDMSKTSNASPDLKSPEVNFWSNLTNKSDNNNILDQNRYFCLTNLIPKSIAAAINNSAAAAAAVNFNNNNNINVSSSSLSSAQDCSNLSTIINNSALNHLPLHDINNNNSVVSLASNGAQLINKITTVDSNDCNGMLDLSKNVSTQQQNNSNSTTNTKRKRKNISVTKLTMNNNGLAYQKKIKLDGGCSSNSNSNNINDLMLDSTSDLASIQSIRAMSQNSCNSINDMLGKSFLNNQHHPTDHHLQQPQHQQQYHHQKHQQQYRSMEEHIHNNITRSSTSLINSIERPSISKSPVISTTHNNIIAYWLIRDLRPYSMLEESGLKTMFSMLMPTITLPTVDQLKHQIVPDIYNQLKSKLLQSFTRDAGCSFSLEIWTNTNTARSYASVKLHYYNQLDNGKLCCQMLHTREINAKQLCSDVLVNCCNELELDDWPVRKHSVIVTNQPDSVRDEMNYWASTNASGCSDSVSGAFSGIVVPCLVSTLRSLVQQGLQQDLVGRLVQQCRELKEVTRAYNLEEERTNSTNTNGIASSSSHSRSMNIGGCEVFLLLQWVLDHLSLIDDKLDTFNSHRLTEEDERFLRQLLPLLEHIYQTLAVIEQNKLVFSVSMIKSIIVTMTKSPFQPKTYDHPGVVQFKLVIRDRLNQIYPGTGPLHEMLWIATLLDPRFKKHKDFSEDELALIEQIKLLIQRQEEEHLQQQIQHIKSNNNNDSGIAGVSPVIATIGTQHNNSCSPTSSIKREDLQFIFGDDLVCGINPTRTSHTEIDQYLTQPKIDIEKDPVEWWRDNKQRYPKLCRLALKYLCIPLSNTNFNNNNSYNSNTNTNNSATSVINERRQLLHPDDIDMFLFLNHNWN